MGVRVLIVDDVVCSRHLVKRGLELLGHMVFDVGNGSEAAAKLDKESFDLIVVDLLIPGKQGFELFNQMARTSGAPIFAMTSNIDEFFLKKAVMFGFKEVIRKPVNFDHFKSLIEKHCLKDGSRSSKVQLTIPQYILDAAQAEAQKAKVPVEAFLGDALTKMFSPQNTPAPEQPEAVSA